MTEASGRRRRPSARQRYVHAARDGSQPDAPLPAAEPAVPAYPPDADPDAKELLALTDPLRDYRLMQSLSFLGAMGFAALGVIASVMLPVLRASLPSPPAGTLAAGNSLLERFLAVAKPYLALALFSIIVSLLVLAAAEAADKPLRAWWEALLAGYVSDSTLQKLKSPT